MDIKKYIKGSFVYAGSAFIFSVIRQIVFFPLLQKFSPEFFGKISFLLITIDFLIYTFGSSVADYYVRLVKHNSLEKGVYKFLIKTCLASFISSLIFLYQDFSFSQSLLLGIYMILFSLNTLQLKVFFNFLIFKKNYFYVFIRLVPYILLIGSIYLFNINSLLGFVLSLVVTELFSFYILYKGNIKLGFYLPDIKEKRDLNVFKFFFIYLSFALVQRMDMFIVEHFHMDKYVNYYQMISIFLIGVNPIVLITSSSLLSILTKVETSVFIKNKIKIAVTIVLIALLSGLIFIFLAPFLINIFYPNNHLIKNFTVISFNVIFFTIIFFVSKAFIVKYVKMNRIVILNILTVAFPLLFINDFFIFTPVFFITRGTLYLIFLLSLNKSNI